MKDIRLACRLNKKMDWTQAWTSGVSNRLLMEAEPLIQSGHCSHGPGHQSQNGGVAASSLSLPALSAPGLSGLLNDQHYMGH